MKKNAVLAQAVAIVLLSHSVSSLAASHKMHDVEFPLPTNLEQCYGIVKAHKNSCGTAHNTCAGRDAKKQDKAAWILLPKGTCDKIAGGSTQKPQKSDGQD